MTEVDLAKRFPDMQPMGGVPSLTTFNGFGFAIYGQRDYDGQTGTFVKTHVLCALFLPVWAISAYRVAQAEQGWYFIGKEPLSRLARLFNCTVLAGVFCLVAGFWWNERANDPERIAADKIQRADQAASAGDLFKAAGLYHEVAVGSTDARIQGREGLQTVFAQSADADPEQARAVFSLALNMASENRWPGGSDEVFQRGIAYARQDAESNPEDALQLLKSLEPLDGKSKQLPTIRREMLLASVERHPENARLASQLAAIYERAGEVERCRALLTPHVAKLGSLEGARILGQLLAANGKFEESYALLEPYTRDRLKNYHRAEMKYNSSLEKAHAKILKQLQQGLGPDLLYKKLDEAEGDDAATQELLNKHFDRRMKNDADVNAARKELAKAAEIVNAALDLGMVRLRRGQGMQDPAARQAELKEAEKTFLAVRGAAGGSDRYQLFLGQVYYWLGKHDEGHQLFDKLLEAKQREPDTLVLVASVIRELGQTAEARALVEEAFNSGDQQQKYAAASIRALMSTSVEDRLSWLENCNPQDQYVQASLHEARARQAQEAGDNKQATVQLLAAIKIYDEMPDRDSKLNNSALAHYTLFGITQDRPILNKGLSQLKRAAKLNPKDSIVQSNLGEMQIQAGINAVLANRIDLKVLENPGDWSLPQSIIKNAEDRQGWRNAVRTDEALAAALENLERAQVLAPKRAPIYANLLNLHYQREDAAALEHLAKLIETHDPDITDLIDATRARYEPADDAARQQTEAAYARSERILAASRKTGMLEFSIAAVDMVDTQLAGVSLGRAVDADKVVALAEEAHRQHPSRATYGCVVQALAHRACEALAQDHKTFDDWRNQAQRSLGPLMLLAAAMDDEKLRAVAVTNDDVYRLVEMLVEAHERFETPYVPLQWALLRADKPDEAKTAVAEVQDDKTGRLARMLNLRLSPAALSNALQVYWHKQIHGDHEGALQALRSCANFGAPIPQWMDPSGEQNADINSPPDDPPAAADQPPQQQPGSI